MLILASCLIKIGDPCLWQVPFTGLSRLFLESPCRCCQGLFTERIVWLNFSIYSILRKEWPNFVHLSGKNDNNKSISYKSANNHSLDHVFKEINLISDGNDLTQCVDSFILDRKAQNLSDGTIRFYHTKMKLLLVFF